MKKTISFLFMLIYGIFFFFNFSQATDWSIETVDSEGSVGDRSSITNDSLSDPHISYRDISNSDLEYAYKKDGVWYLETVDSIGTVGIDTSLNIDSSDNPHIGYKDSSNNNIKYTYKLGGVWNTEIAVHIDSDHPRDISHDLDTSNNPHISYDGKNN
ncbi:MAG: hypothetical protein HQ538_03380, partial [Parcubacteria group bacterium]|nr:hypothetical protein [Parcubacteria group bacterium]